MGEDREHVGALLILDLGAVKRLAKKRGCSPKRLFASPDIRLLLKQQVDSIAQAEKIEAHYLPRPLPPLFPYICVPLVWLY